MKIALISHYYPPETGAPQARLSEMADTWQKEGHPVTVITGFPNHPTGIIPDTYKAKQFQEETLNGIKVIRCRTYATPNSGFLKKIIGHLFFMCTAVIQGAKYVKGNDIIIVSSPTFFSVISAYIISRRYHIPYVFEVRDLWPAIFKDLGVLKNPIILGILEKLELFLYKKAKYVVPVTHSFAKDIISRGIPKEKVFTITNGVTTSQFSPKEKNSDLLKEHRLEDKFVVLYIGAHGISQGLPAFVDVANTLQKSHPNIHFLFVGEGADKKRLMEKAQQYTLTNMTFLPNQPKEKVSDFYASMDIGLVPLRNIPLFKTFIPSKMFEMMAMEKPIIASLEGEAADILEASKGALICPPENAQAITSAILKLYASEELRNTLRKNARSFVLKYYDREQLAKNYLKNLTD